MWSYSLRELRKHQKSVPILFSFRRMLRLFLPVFTIAAITPFLLSHAFNYSRAEKTNELRLWLVPGTIIVKPNETVKLDVLGSFADPVQFFPDLTVAFETSTEISLTPNPFVVKQPFQGRKKLGSITIKPQRAGTYSIAPAQTIQTSYAKEYVFIRGKATIIV